MLGRGVDSDQLQRRTAYYAWAAKLSVTEADQIRYYALAFETALNRLTTGSIGSASAAAAISVRMSAQTSEQDLENLLHLYKQLLHTCLLYGSQKWLLTQPALELHVTSEWSLPHQNSGALKSDAKGPAPPALTAVSVPVRALVQRMHSFVRDFANNGLYKRVAALHAELGAALLDRLGKQDAERGEEEGTCGCGCWRVVMHD
jgi:hypothetical protein